MSSLATSPFSAEVFAHPCCASVAPYAARLGKERAWPAIPILEERYADRLSDVVAGRGLTLEAMQQSSRQRGPRARGDMYEWRVHAEGRLPMRDGSWHDLMNLLVWCAFPLSKRRLVARQHAIAAALIDPEQRGLPQRRTREQDALAILDEGGVLVLCRPGAELDVAQPGALTSALASGAASLRVFGHAILEAAATGELEQRDLRGAAVVLGVADPHATAMDEADRALAAHIDRRDVLLAPDRARSLWVREPLAVQAARGGPR